MNAVKHKPIATHLFEAPLRVVISDNRPYLQQLFGASAASPKAKKTIART